jgi:hypothetical protein
MIIVIIIISSSISISICISISSIIIISISISIIIIIIIIITMHRADHVFKSVGKSIAITLLDMWDLNPISRSALPPLFASLSARSSPASSLFPCS